MTVFRFEFLPMGLFYFGGEKSNFRGTVKRSKMLVRELKVDRQEEQLLKVDGRKRLGKIAEKCTVHQGELRSYSTTAK
jgi:hypothetical protein